VIDQMSEEGIECKIKVANENEQIIEWLSKWLDE
jgi:hypothetical protein